MDYWERYDQKGFLDWKWSNLGNTQESLGLLEYQKYRK